MLKNLNQLNKHNIAPFDLALTKFFHLLRNKNKVIPKKYLINNFKDYFLNDK